MKRIYTFLIAVISVTTLFAQITSGTCGDNLTWKFQSEERKLVIEGEGSMYDYQYGFYGYWGNEDKGEVPWSHLSSDIKTILLPDGLTSIGEGAFCGLQALQTISIPNSVETIGYAAFAACNSLTSVNFGTNIARIGSVAFAFCSAITIINIPNSVTEIGYEAFYKCTALKSVTIPNGVTRIDYYVFDGCTSLEYLSIPNSVEYTYRGDYGELRYNDGYRSIMNCPNLKTLIVPADFFGVDEEFDGDYQHVKSDYFPYLPEKLESLTINDGTIHRLAWDFISRNYKTLKTIDLATTTDIAIAEEAFKNCYKLENLALPSQLEYIPYMAIAECVKLQSITIPATVTEIEDRAFENCRSVKSIIFGGAAPAQGPAHYAAASGSSLWRIGSWAFYNCHQLQQLTIPEGVTELGDAAFYGCTYLEEMSLPSTIQLIGDNGFALCDKLEIMYVKAPVPPTIQAKTFYNVKRKIPVYVPLGAVDLYKNDTYWSEFKIMSEEDAVENVTDPNAYSVRKLLRNGQLIILRDGVEYNTLGMRL